ncbi:galactoside alpha-(1,2)-fucosyltransferase 2-like [Euwallacea fornicatus]|uniref:galactoside alpha-(1,2)-fucosyltransferase 2-like n=1 Tax=Euwallacea fornicatus TaxID=995702 RepID=UPI00338E6DC3
MTIMAQKRLIFLLIVICTGILSSFFYILNSNKLIQQRHEFIEVRETFKNGTVQDYELWLASSEETDNSVEDLPSNKSYPEIFTNFSQQYETPQNRTTIADLREYLCHKEKESTKRTFEKSAVGDPCPNKPIVTYIAGGRTGNQMWKYAEIWTIAQITGLTPYIPGCIKHGVSELFEKISIPNMDKIAHCIFDGNDTAVKSIKNWNGNQSIIISRFQFNRGLVMPYLHRVVKEQFVFKKKLRLNAQTILREATNGSNPELITFVGVHVRRTDYIKYLKIIHSRSTATYTYYHKAMTYFKNKYKKCLFVFVSDDPEWCHEQFGALKDVFVASYQKNNTAGEDLAIMAACNHSIIDYGTYGEWGAILAGGETIFALKSFKGSPTAKLKGWKFME